PIPSNPQNDPQYEYWEYGVRNWYNNWRLNNPGFVEENNVVIPSLVDDIHVASNLPVVNITSPVGDIVSTPGTSVALGLTISSVYPIIKSELYINDRYISSYEQDPRNISFIPRDAGAIVGNNLIKVVVYDNVLNRSEDSINLLVQE
ncbi:MAG TPA: hypothetical protein VJC02_01725, partial [Candidatus Paceibacterota bacterium]